MTLGQSISLTIFAMRVLKTPLVAMDPLQEEQTMNHVMNSSHGAYASHA
jgi:hypothetical protein